jgi:hypothetical protein
MTNYDFSMLEIEDAYDNLVATRTENPDRDQTMTYVCSHCGQNVGDLVAHRDVFHPDLAQRDSKRALGIGGVAKRVITPILVLGTLLGGCNPAPRDLTPQDFVSAHWGKYNNTDGEIWDEYMGENIPRSSDNWRIYQEQVKKHNQRNELTGVIELPDLDTNNYVGP